MPTALVVGYGSIGQRHARLLRQLGCDVGVVSRRDVDHPRRFSTLDAALDAMVPDYVVDAGATAEHAATLAQLLHCGYSGKLLIEKPLGGGVVPPAEMPFSLAAVGYNLRFHPMVQMLVDVLKNDQPIAIQIYCGQYLPDWRPGADWRSSYSTKGARGGGVLRDLSHELDYLLLLGGSWRRVAALGGHLSSLEISSDDCWGLLVELDRCPVASLSVDYLNRSARRQIVINTNRHSYCADLVRGVMSCDGQEQSFVVARDDTYLAQHRAMLSADETWLCLLPHAERVMRLIGAAERAAAEKTWVAA